MKIFKAKEIGLKKKFKGKARVFQTPNIFECPDRIKIPTLSELIEAVMSMVNELSMGWNDGGCFWHFQYGPRGAGSMMEGIGKTFAALESELLEEAVANLYLALKKK